MEMLRNLYDQFVGRDLFAKMGPGAILLAAIAQYLGYHFSDLSGLSVGDWTFAAVLSWLAGLGMQSLGEWSGVLRYYPKGTSSKAWHDRVGLMLEVPQYREKYQTAYERLVVIKEACGIASIALTVAMALLLWRYNLEHNLIEEIGPFATQFGPIILLVVVMIFALSRMHHKHVHRQADYVDRVLIRAAGRSLTRWVMSERVTYWVGERERMSKPGFHTWTQTICIVVQAIAVAAGVFFAIANWSHWTEDRDQQRREEAFNLLKSINQEPVHPAIEFVNETQAGTVTAGMPWMPIGPSVSEVDFDKRAEPLKALFADLEVCLRNDLCDRDTSAAEVCSIFQTYHYAWIETRTTRPGAPWKVPVSPLFDICPSVKAALSKFYDFAQ